MRLCREVRASPPKKKKKKNEGLDYDTKQSDDVSPKILEFWGMWNTTLLPSLPGPLWPGVVAPDRVLSMGQIELFDI